ncbi:MAG: hypothetical protein K9G60_11550 [Pseudolabrys sp.]|nr:hypothetical protein [Pseudolabrys sp.]
MGNGNDQLTEADLLAGGCRPIRAFVLPAETDAVADHYATAQNGAAGENGPAVQNDAAGKNGAAADDGKPQSGSERTKKYRESKKGKQQLNLMATTDPEKRATLKELAQDIEIDGVHAVCAMAVRAKADARTLEAMRVAGDAPDVLALGVLASHIDVRPVVDGVIENREVRNVAAACLDDRETCGRVAAIVRNPSTLQGFAAVAASAELRACLLGMIAEPAFLDLCSGIRQDRQLRHAAQAAQANPSVAVICVQLATGAPGVLDNIAAAIKHPDVFELGKRATISSEVRRAVESAITRPRATALGHKIMSLPGMRGQMLRKLVALLLKPGSRAG